MDTNNNQTKNLSPIQKSNKFYLFKNFIKFNYKNLELLAFAIALLVIAILLRVSYFNYESIDYKNFLKPWFEEISGYKGLLGFGSSVGNYTPLYKYFITLATYLPINSLYSYKILSCIFDVILAIYVYKTVKFLTKDKVKALLAYGVILFLPNVFLNSGVWAQCDSIFTCFLVMSFYYVLAQKSNKALIMFGIAVSLKVQGLFFLPFVGLCIMRGKLKLHSIVFGLLSFVLCAVPAIMAGMGFYEALLGGLVEQVDSYNQLTLNAPNFYIFIVDNYKGGEADMANLALFFSIGVIAVLCIYLYRGDVEFSNKNLPIIAYLIVVIVPYVLPHMHERYFYIADIFAVIFIFTHSKVFYIGAITIYSSMRAIIWYLFDRNKVNVDFNVLAVLMLIGIILLIVYAIKQLKPQKTLVADENNQSQYIEVN